MSVDSTLTGFGTNAYIHDEHLVSDAGSLKLSAETTPFVLNLGGAGASYSNRGGIGHASMLPQAAYVTQEGVHLLGGTGGACGGTLPLTGLNFGKLFSGNGGHGGGVIEIAAMNDLTIGLDATITAHGQDGVNDHEAGGGGSGGT